MEEVEPDVPEKLRGKHGDREGSLLALGLNGWDELLLPRSGESPEKELHSSWICQDPKALGQSPESVELQETRVWGGVLVGEVQNDVRGILVLQGGPKMTEIITHPSVGGWWLGIKTKLVGGK